MALGGHEDYEDWIISRKSNKQISRKDIRKKLGLPGNHCITGVLCPEFRDLADGNSEVVLVSIPQLHDADFVPSRLKSPEWITRRLPPLVVDRVEVVLNRPDVVFSSIGKDVLTECGLTVKSTKSDQYLLEGRWHQLQEGHYRLDLMTALVKSGIKVNKQKIKELHEASLKIYEQDKYSSLRLRDTPLSRSLPTGEKRNNPQIGTRRKDEISWQHFEHKSIHIRVGVGDITGLHVDVIVNSANSILRHSDGVAAAISSAAGKEMDKECHDLIKVIGPLGPGQCIMTNAGKLPCKCIIHAIGPSRSEYKRVDECINVLKQTYTACLREAGNHNFNSIAIPGVGAGRNGIPKPQVGAALSEALKEFCKANAETENTVKTIYFVDVDLQLIQAVTDIFSADRCFIMIEKREKYTGLGTASVISRKSERYSHVGHNPTIGASAPTFIGSLISRFRRRGEPDQHSIPTGCHEVFEKIKAEIKSDVLDILLHVYGKGTDQLKLFERDNGYYIEALWDDFARSCSELQQYAYTSDAKLYDTEILKCMNRYFYPAREKLESDFKIKYFEWNEPHNKTKIKLSGRERECVAEAESHFQILYESACERIASTDITPKAPGTDISEEIASIEVEYCCIIEQSHDGRIHICGKKENLSNIENDLVIKLNLKKQRDRSLADLPSNLFG